MEQTGTSKYHFLSMYLSENVILTPQRISGKMFSDKCLVVEHLLGAVGSDLMVQCETTISTLTSDLGEVMTELGTVYFKPATSVLSVLLLKR